MLREPDVKRADFASLRLCRAGGDQLPAELSEEYRALTDQTIDEGYGSTEAGMIMLNPLTGSIRPGSVGKLLPGFSAVIGDHYDQSAPDGQEGELWVRSPTLTMGYWCNQSATDTALIDGWLDTGDRMRCDKDDYYWFCGRSKQIIVHDGSNIYPQEVENVLLKHSSVASAGVIGVHDRLHGERVRAYVTMKEGAPLPGAVELIELARREIGYKAPEEIIFIATMPLTVAGKIDRSALKKMAEKAIHRNS